jgi:ribosomal protein L11 methyltransferase
VKYTEVKFLLPEVYTEIVIAELNEAGYDSFAETGNGLLAYIESTSFNENSLLDLQAKYAAQFEISYTIAPLEEKNWNEEWEKNFPPVIIKDVCIIRGDFYLPDKHYLYDIVINPKMSFGTGHHETTAMMIEHLLAMNLNRKQVMDAGSGTGILSIMASKLGAHSVIAFDIEQWAFENCIENISQNHCSNISVSIGSIGSVSLPPLSFDTILANINKNVLLSEMTAYTGFLKSGGDLILSGFYDTDVKDIAEEAGKHGLTAIDMKTKNNWASIRYEKKKPV